MKLLRGLAAPAALLLVACPIKDDDNDDVGVSSSSGGAVTTISASDDGSGGSEEEETGGDGMGETTAPATDSGGESGPMEECPGGRCMAQVPDGWMGPIAIYRGLADGSDVPVCGEEGFDSPGLTMLEGYHDPGPAGCECECSVNLSGFCNMTVQYYGPTCSTYQGSQTMGEDCEDLDIDGGAYFSMWQSGVANCQANKTVDLPEVAWDAMVSSCAGVDQTQACEGGGYCTPQAPEGYNTELCVFAQGDMECPADTYTEKFTVYNGADDTRGCGVCFCGTGTATCAGDLEVYPTTDCSGTPQVSLLANQTGCNAAAAGGGSVQVNFTGTQSCPVDTPPEPVGEINPGTSFTYCCEAGM